jgi:hypothetical protein
MNVSKKRVAIAFLGIADFGRDLKLKTILKLNISSDFHETLISQGLNGCQCQPVPVWKILLIKLWTRLTSLGI